MMNDSNSQPPSVFDSLTTDTMSAAESLTVMMEQECKTYYRGAYLNEQSTDSNAITTLDRMKIADWCFSVVDHCQFSRETVSVAMELMDRFLSVQVQSPQVQEILHDKKQFQLAAMSALYIAIKLHERVAFGSDLMAAMSRGTYSVAEIEAMEMVILKGVSWRVCAPTSLQMAHYILSLVLPHTSISEEKWGMILDEVRFQTENSVREYSFTMQRQSTVAMAAILNALEQVDNEGERESLFEALLFVMKDFGFAPSATLFMAKKCLRHLIGGDQDLFQGEMEVDISSPKVTKPSLLQLEAELTKNSPRTVVQQGAYLR